MIPNCFEDRWVVIYPGDVPGWTSFSTNGVLRGLDSDTLELLGGHLSKQVQIQWYPEPEDHDYPAAESYLSLLYDDKTAATYVARLKSIIGYVRSTLSMRMG